MYRSLILFLVIAVVISCAGPEKLIQQGEYDHAVNQIVKKLHRKPDDQKSISLLRTAYNRSNSADLDSIQALRRSGQPDIWYDIHRIYKRLENRQSIVSVLPVNALKEIGYKKVSYEKDTEQSRINAMTYLYAHARELLNSEGKENARLAYEDLYRITEISRGYKDTEALMRYALLKGTSYVLLKVNNNTGYPIPPSIIKTINGIDLQEYERKFLRFDIERKSGREYTYTILVELNKILISPLRTKKTSYTLTRKVPVERRGTRVSQSGQTDTAAMIQESTGLEKAVSCQVTDYIQEKHTIIAGWVNIIDDEDKTTLYMTPLRAESVYRHIYSKVEGDKRACNSQILSRIDASDLPVPDDDAMVMDAAMKFRGLLKQTIWDEDYLLK